jgi:hypothetical protein
MEIIFLSMGITLLSERPEIEIKNEELRKIIETTYI